MSMSMHTLVARRRRVRRLFTHEPIATTVANYTSALYPDHIIPCKLHAICPLHRSRLAIEHRHDVKPDARAQLLSVHEVTYMLTLCAASEMLVMEEVGPQATVMQQGSLLLEAC